MAELPQISFAAGEVSEDVASRVDLSKRAVAAALIENFIPTATGSVDNRPGSQFVARCKGTGSTRLLPFAFNDTDTLVVELGDSYARFHASGAQVLDSNSTSSITGATSADPVVVTTSAAHNLSSNDEVYLTGVGGMTELNGRNFLVTVLTTTTFSIQTLDGDDVDGTGYTAYTSGGTVYPVYEVTTPWAAADLFDLRFSQLADVLTITHPDYTPQELIRTANDNWSVGDVDLIPQTSYPSDLEAECRTTVETFSISNITRANPAVVTTSTTHTYETGDIVHITGAVGMVQINHFQYSITKLTGSTFSLQHVDTGANINSTSFGTYASGATATTVVNPRQYTVTAVDADTGEESLHGLDNRVLTITGISQANPAVVTVTTGHGLRDLDEIEISGVAGMTELNGLRFEAIYISNTSFSIRYLSGEDVDSTTFTAYSSGGSVYPLFTEVVSSADSDWNNVLQWTPVAGASDYNVYASSTFGVMGFIGTTGKARFQDRNISPDTTVTPPHAYSPFADPLNTGNFNPGCVGFFQQRRVFGNTNGAPNRLYLSQTGNIYNFSRSQPSRDSDAFNASILSPRVDEIKHLVPLSDLIAFTAGGEYAVNSYSGAGIAPTTIQLKAQSYYGSTNLRPLVSGGAALFMSPGTHIRDLNYQFSEDKFVARDMTVLARHLFNGKVISDWDFASSPYSLIWAVRSDGRLLSMTYQQEQDVYAWAQHSTSGKYKSVCVIPESNNDTPYFVVLRTVGGVQRQFIERLPTRDFDDIQDAVFVDAGLTYDAPFTITGATSANPVVVTTSSAHGFNNGDTVDIAGIMAASSSDNTGEALSDDFNGVGYTVANATATTFELSAVDGSAFAAYSSGGEARKAVTTISGLWHLEGGSVVAAANGVPVDGLTVSNGSVTLSSAASRIHIGLPYTSRLKTLPIDIYERGGNTKGRKVMASRTSIEVSKSRGMWYGPSSGLLREASFATPASGKPPEMTTSNVEVTMKGDWERRKQILIEQRDPLPMSILSVTPDYTIGGL
jgi:hypothetical protein